MAALSCVLVACALGGVFAGVSSQAPSDANAAAPASAQLLFGLGPEADVARRSEFVRQSRVRMLTSWYNGPGDLGWMTRWRTTEVPRAYGAGYAMHLIVFSDGPEVPLKTRYGQACGRPYPLADRFLGDMRRLARTFAGDSSEPPLYVTLFTEFQTYPCRDNAWAPDGATRAYYRALKDRYRATLKIFHRHAPNAQVSLGWGGWQTRWDDPSRGGGRSMFCRFADVMSASDFQSFQAMESKGNSADISAMTRTLGAYGPVMLAHLKPDDGSQTSFDADVRKILSDRSLRRLRRHGLFALSFMDTANLDGGAAVLEFVRQSVSRHGLRSVHEARVRSLIPSVRSASGSERSASAAGAGRRSCRAAAARDRR